MKDKILEFVENIKTGSKVFLVMNPGNLRIRKNYLL